jgi:hypothetical protein
MNKTQKEMEHIAIPKGIRLQHKDGMIRAIKGEKIGMWHKGFKIVQAISPKQAFKKAFNVEIKNIK